MGVGLLSLAGCGSSGPSGQHAVHEAPPAVENADVAILQDALLLERRAVAAYIASIPYLPHSLAKGARAFLNEELAHCGEVISLIKAAGGTAADKAPSYDIGHASDQAGVLIVLHWLESQQIAFYLRSIPRLSPGPVRAAVAAILACDAQHVAILRGLEGKPPLASPFVSGSV